MSATTITSRIHTVAPQTELDAKSQCAAAKECENRGDFEAARQSLSGVWTGIGVRPMMEGLEPEVRAEVLLRVGALSGWLGSSRQIADSQAFAKDLISESIREFEALGDQEKLAEAQTDLAICYWREGAMDEARVWFREALAQANSPVSQLRALVNSTLVEHSSNRPVTALSFLDQAGALVDQVQDPAAKGRYHMQRAIMLMELGGAENLDRALIENSAASFHFEEANHWPHFARVENNTGFIFFQLGRYQDALEHLNQAKQKLIDLNDQGGAAQINETRARVFLAQGLHAEAEKLASAAAAVLESGGEQALVAEALETQGIAQARMGRHQFALETLTRSTEIAETAGNIESAGRTFLSIIEELKSFLDANDIGKYYREADQRLGEQLSPETVSRLRASARLLSPGAPVGGPESAQASFQDQVLRCESDLIKRALDDAQGSVTRAAKVLGLTHQGLCYIINHRHQTLLNARAPIRVRRKSLIKKR